MFEYSSKTRKYDRNYVLSFFYVIASELEQRNSSFYTCKQVGALCVCMHIFTRLLKGTTFHWDLMLTGFINILMSCLGLPWMHAAFPHSSLHARQLAKVEQHVEDRHVYTT